MSSPLLVMVEEVIAQIKITGWLAQFNFRWRAIEIWDTRHKTIDVTIDYTTKDVATDIDMPLIKQYTIVEKIENRLIIFAGEVDGRRLTVDVPSDADPRQAIANAIRQTILCFLEHEVGEMMNVGDRLPWYPSWDHSQTSVTPKNAGWGLFWANSPFATWGE